MFTCQGKIIPAFDHPAIAVTYLLQRRTDFSSFATYKTAMQCLVYDSVVSIYPSCVDLPLEKDYSPFTEAGDGRTVYAVKANGYIN